MKILVTMIGTMAPAAVYAAPVLLEAKNSMFMWVFLGFCELIVIGQILRTVLMHFVSTKGLATKDSKEKVMATICRCIYEADQYRGKEGRDKLLEDLNSVD